jgi:protein-S-isoprenylcysteine O-methyltransferase Ste14
LLALLGTTVAVGEVRGLLAVAIAWLSFYTKARREECFLTQEFGDRFAEHTPSPRAYSCPAFHSEVLHNLRIFK